MQVQICLLAQIPYTPHNKPKVIYANISYLEAKGEPEVIDLLPNHEHVNLKVNREKLTIMIIFILTF